MPIEETTRAHRRRLAQIAAGYAEEERAAAGEEIREREERDQASLVYSVRLPRDVYDVVRAIADREHLTPSALIRRWVSERAQEDDQDDIGEAMASVRREVDRLARLVRPA